jgi:hypothetical protein
MEIPMITSIWRILVDIEGGLRASFNDIDLGQADRRQCSSVVVLTFGGRFNEDYPNLRTV